MASGDENNYISLESYINELRTSISLWEDVTLKFQKMTSNLKSTSQGLNTVIESVGCLFTTNSQKNYSGIEKVESLLHDVCSRETYMTNKVMSLNSSIQNNLVHNLSFHIDNWKRSISNLKKERDSDCRRAKIDYKKALNEFNKLEAKFNKFSASRKLSDNFTLQVDYAKQNLLNKKKYIEDLDRCSLRKAIYEERSRLKQFLECLRPVLDTQLSIRADLDHLQIIYDKLYSSNLDDLAILPPDIDAFVRQYHNQDRSRVNSISSLQSLVTSQWSLSSSQCSSIENPFFITKYLHGASTPIGNQGDNLENSSLTIHDINNVPPPDIYDGDEDTNSSSESREDLANKSLRTQELQYQHRVNQLPPYSNLMDMKERNNQKFGSSSFLRDRGNSVCSDLSIAKRASLISDIRLVHDFPGYSPFQDNNGLANTRGVDILVDNLSRGSTFKRCKPCTLTAMNAPVITSNHVTRNYKPEHGNAVMKRRSSSLDRSNRDLSHAYSGLENMLLGPKLANVEPSATDKRNYNSFSTHRNNHVASQDRLEYSSIYPSSNYVLQQIPGKPMKPKLPSEVNSGVSFKQQLLKVIQGSPF